VKSKEEESIDVGSMLLLAVVVGFGARILLLFDSGYQIGGAIFLFFAPVLVAWAAVVILGQMSEVPIASSLSVWMLCVAGSGLGNNVLSPNVASGDLPSDFMAFFMIILGLAEKALFVSATAGLVVGLSFVPLAWCAERGRGEFLGLVRALRLVVFLGVLIFLGRELVGNLIW
jgi:hypothetical protein